MSIEEQLLKDMNLALKAGKKLELETVRMLRAQIKRTSIDKKDELTDSEVAQVLQKEAKKRKEAMEMYRSGGREDLVNKESAELDIIAKYLPEQLSEEEIEKVIRETVSDMQVSSEKDMGRVMGAVMPKVKGKADGKLVQQKVKDVFATL
jgi:uncharacterized protein YqeY